MKLLDVDVALQQIKRDVEALNAAKPVLLGEAALPNTHGVYMFLVGDEVKYIGEAKGSQGLRDRMRKHLSGDEGHSIQKALKEEFPNRLLRRDHIKKTVYVRWVHIEDTTRISAVECFLIWLHQPPWNTKK